MPSRTGIAELPLHTGKCPKWLFSRMVPLAESIVELIYLEYGSKEVLKRLADPFWFQALGCVIGFDWHSSGLTTTTIGALKEALNKNEEIPIKVAGGKGKNALKTPEDIKANSFILYKDKYMNDLIKSSRFAARIDNSFVQDGYELYHHAIVFDEKGHWCVVQQGLNETSNYARRYHWFGKGCNFKVVEPHSGIYSQNFSKTVLDFTSKENEELRKSCVDALKEKERWVCSLPKNNLLRYALKMPADHFHLPLDEKDKKALKKIENIDISNFQDLVWIKGLGKKGLRALALVSSLIYGTEISWRDPAKYSYSHGGKDGVPYPVNKRRMDKTIEVLKDAIKNAKLKDYEKKNALKRLAKVTESVLKTCDN